MKRLYSIDAPDQQRLKIARAEIEGVLRKHDLAGAVVLHTPGMTEWFYDVRPSYSCAWIDEAANAVRVKSKLADFNGDPKAQLQGQVATANLFHSLASDLAHAAGMFIEASAIVDLKLNAEHTPAGFVPDSMEARRQ